MKKVNFGGRHLSIPHEIIFEIFSSLPVKSIIRFRCVSKFCNSLVFESDFLDIHRRRRRPGGIKLFLHERKAFYAAKQEEDGNISAFRFQTERFNERYDYVPADSRMNCANGLLCVWEPSSVQPVVIFNPSTREVRFLVDPNKGRYSREYLLGFDPEENKYKVFLSKWGRGYVKQWVLTLGVDEWWRETRSVSPFITFGKPSVCISGVIYQFVTAHKCAIAALDVKSEKFEIISLWNASHWLFDYNVVEVKGKLAVVDNQWVDNFDLWILEKAPKREWQRHTIQFPSIWNYKVFGPISSCTSFNSDGKIVFIRNLKMSCASCWCYDVITRSWRKLGIEGLPEKFRIKGIYSCMEALDRCI